MGQQPNIELEIADLPRPTPAPAPARRWRPERPGELTAPRDVPWGGAYGTVGPDTGYALALVAQRDLELTPAESRRNVDVAVAAVAAARASRFGRAPTRDDIDVALLALGLDGHGIPDDALERLAGMRRSSLSGLAHHPHKAGDVVARIPVDVLEATPAELRARLAAGEEVFGS